jgi:hypothetical protein
MATRDKYKYIFRVFLERGAEIWVRGWLKRGETRESVVSYFFYMGEIKSCSYANESNPAEW